MSISITAGIRNSHK